MSVGDLKKNFTNYLCAFFGLNNVPEIKKIKVTTKNIEKVPVIQINFLFGDDLISGLNAGSIVLKTYSFLTSASISFLISDCINTKKMFFKSA